MWNNQFHSASWTDHSRDLLHLVNTFRDRMPRPVIGVGHSMGACQIANVALMHPSLFSTLVLIEPGIMRHHTLERNWITAKASADRRDIWPDREAAVASLRTKSLYRNGTHVCSSASNNMGYETCQLCCIRSTAAAK